MTETARTLADDILKAAGSALRHYEAYSQERIIAVAQRYLESEAMQCANIAAVHAASHKRGLVHYGSADKDEGRGRQEGHINAGREIEGLIKARHPYLAQHGEEA